MSRLSRLGRLAAAATLAVSTVAVFSAAPAGATNTNAIQNCATGSASISIDNGDTYTITIPASTCGYADFALGSDGSATLNGSPMTLGANDSVSAGATIVYTAPASGSGSATFQFFAALGQAPVSSLNISFPAATGSLADNGDGTVNVSYSGEVVLFLLTSGSVCPADLSMPPQFIYVSDSGAHPGPAPLPASPFVLSASTTMYRAGSGGPGNVELVAAGSYQACMYDIMANAQLASTAVSIGQAAPTTTTTTVTPVTPAFTG